MANTDPNYACGTYGADTYNGCDEVAATPVPTTTPVATATPKASPKAQAVTPAGGTATPAPEATASPEPTVSPAASPSPAHTVAPGGGTNTPTDTGASSGFGGLGWMVGGLLLLALLAGLVVWIWRRRTQADIATAAVVAPPATSFMPQTPPPVSPVAPATPPVTPPSQPEGSRIDGLTDH